MDNGVRDVVNTLRGYGATNLRIEPGGKHQKLHFTIGDMQRTILLNRKLKIRAVWNFRAALKREFGPPRELKEHEMVEVEIVKPQSVVQTMPEDLSAYVDNMLNENVDLSPHALILEHGEPVLASTPEPTTPAKTWPVSIGAYCSQDSARNKSFTQVNFYFPVEIIERFPGGMAVERLDDENWKLYPVEGTGKSVLHFRQQGNRRARMSYTDGSVEAFQVVDGEALEADDTLLIYLPMSKREDITHPRPKVATVRPAPVPAPVPVKSALPTPPPERMTDLEEQMREITNRVRVIEAMCPYRLVRLEGGRILWRAPIIE